MKKISKILLSATLALAATTIPVANVSANAQTLSDETVYTETIYNATIDTERVDEIQERLFTNLTVGLLPGTNCVTGAVYNGFTLFPSTIVVYLYLFKSSTYQTNINNMTRVAYSYTADLDYGQEMTATAPTNGEQMYWCAFIIYSENGAAERTLQSQTIRFDADGALNPNQYV